MSSITKQNMGKYTYLNESESFWHKDKKCPGNRKIRIGMIGNTTGKKYYKQEYIDRLKSQGKSVDWMHIWKDLRTVQRISELLAGFGYNEWNRFYKEWYTLIREREYIALDITSVSSYSDNITECEWGYNRDGKDLPQISICMLFGKSSHLPVNQTIYIGSLKDVSTLKTTLR